MSSSLITSDKIYYKLKWHEKADTKKAKITFLNLGKLKTISYHDWIPLEKGGEIPWHRIYQYHYQDEILWDRNERYINLDLLEIEKVFSNIEMLKYSNKKWHISKNNSDKLPDQIDIITFNCLMDLYDKNITDTKLRLPYICKYLEEYDADIVCLQEITIKMKNYIMKNEFIQNNYYISSNEPKIYGQIILTKFKPISQNLVTLNGNHMKKYLHLLYENSNSDKVEVYNIHLTSDDQINSEVKRDAQIDQILNQMGDNRILICGDFNSEFDINLLHDSWKVLKNNEEGFTIDNLENELTNKITRSFSRKRIDKILFKNLNPLDIKLAFNKPINRVFCSDHFGLLLKTSVIDTYEDNNCEELDTKYKSYILKPGNVLCYILNPKLWENINEIRKLHDEGFYKIPPHITLFQKFVEINEWYELKSQIDIGDTIVKFDKLEIFNLEIKFVLVITSSEDYKINNSRSKLENILNIKQKTKPHITLGEFESEKKVISIKNSIEKYFFSNGPLEISLNNLSFMKKVNDQYIIYDSIGSYQKYNVIELISFFIRSIIKSFEIKIVGSRAFGIENTDYDLVIFGDIDEKIFNEKFYLFSRMTPYLKFSKYIESKINSFNLVTIFNDEINLIYSNRENKIKNIHINESIEHIEIIKKLLGNKFDLFCKCFYCIRTWAIVRNIYGSKYGFLNGIAWLYLSLNIFLKYEFRNKKEFVRKFFDFYSEYDWSLPININNLKVDISTHSDKIIYISSLIINSSNVVRNISKNTFNIILNEISIAKYIEDLNNILKKKEIPQKYLKITINDQFEIDRIDKKNKVSSEIWKLSIHNDIEPNIKWIENEDNFIYYLGINNISQIDNLINYFKKFNTLVEFNLC